MSAALAPIERLFELIFLGVDLGCGGEAAATQIHPKENSECGEREKASDKRKKMESG